MTMRIIKWAHIKLSFNASAHRPAKELAIKLKRIKAIWNDVGGFFIAECWAQGKLHAKDLLTKTAMLNLIGAWGRTQNYRHNLLTTSHPDDIPFNGIVETRPAPHSEQTDSGYIFHDVAWKQKIL